MSRTIHTRAFRAVACVMAAMLFVQLPASSQEQNAKRHFLDGIAVGADLVGPVMKMSGSDWSQMEVFARLNLYDKYFPVFELGYGECDHEGREQDNHCAVKAPYFRVGADYCFTKKHNGNRLLGGLRYGFSAYDYDLDSPLPLTDPVWGTSRPFVEHGLNGKTHWAEVVLGVETRLFSIVSMGWDMRFKFRVSQAKSDIGAPWYVPGMSENNNSINWGGTFRIVFDLTRK